VPLIHAWWMVCQYSRPGPVSSEKYQVTPGTGADGRGGIPRWSGLPWWSWADTILGASFQGHVRQDGAEVAGQHRIPCGQGPSMHFRSTLGATTMSQ
jgi:hypothetical protein